MTAEPRYWGGVSHPLQLTTGLVIKSITTSPTFGRCAYAFYSLVSIRKNVFKLTQNTISEVIFSRVYIFMCCFEWLTFLLRIASPA